MRATYDKDNGCLYIYFNEDADVARTDDLIPDHAIIVDRDDDERVVGIEILLQPGLDFEWDVKAATA